jgi:predicted permease
MVRVARLAEARSSVYRPTLRLLLGASALLLIVGCANVSILLLARGATRQQELGVRLAIGASRGRVVQQLLIESIVLMLAGATLGVALARWVVPRAITWLPQSYLPPDVQIAVGWPVVLGAAAVACAAGLLFGLSPAIGLTGVPLAPTLQGNVLQASTTWQRKRAHQVMIAAQVAITIVLLAGAGSALRSFIALTRVALGINPEQLLVATIPLAEGAYDTWPARRALFDAIQSRVAALPDARNVAMSFFCCAPKTALVMAGQIDEADAGIRPTSVQRVTPSYFPTLQIPLLQGRLWNEAEHMQAAHVAVVDRRTAHLFWPGVNPIGRRVRMPTMTAQQSWEVGVKGSNDWLEVIGVVGDTQNGGFQGRNFPVVYVPITLVMGDIPSLIVRTRGEALGLAGAIRDQVYAVDPNQPVATITTAEEIRRSAVGWARAEIAASLCLLFAVGGLLLASVGLYSVVAYVVSQRTREFGIRSALGARSIDLVGRALASTAVAAVVGAIIGAGVTLAAGSKVVRWTQVDASDPSVVALVALLLMVVAALATLIPARQASRVDPQVALRQ